MCLLSTCCLVQVIQAEAPFAVLANGGGVNNDCGHVCSPLISEKEKPTGLRRGRCSYQRCLLSGFVQKHLCYVHEDCCDGFTAQTIAL